MKRANNTICLIKIYLIFSFRKKKKTKKDEQTSGWCVGKIETFCFSTHFQFVAFKKRLGWKVFIKMLQHLVKKMIFF